MENLQKRVPIIALLLSLFTPGMGQMYNGQLKRATVFYLGGLLLTIVKRKAVKRDALKILSLQDIRDLVNGNTCQD
jgi:hypothetical protein